MAIFIPLVTKFDGKGLNNATRALANFQNFAVDVGRIAAAAIAAVGVASVREAVTFETTFAKIQGLVGLTSDEIAELEKAARTLGPQFGKSANEAAEGLFFITSAGLRGTEATEVLEAALKGAAIGLGSVEDIANAATAAMNTYGSEVLSGTEATDALAEAVRLGQFSPEELAGALGRVIPIASELGISFQETTGLIAGLTRGGLSATEAVTGVRGAMQAFLKPTAEAATMMEKYGLTTEGVSDSIEKDGFLQTLINLREAFGDNEEDFTRVIGSIEGLNAVLALTGPNVATNTDIIAQMTDGVGILDDALDIVQDTAANRFAVAMETAKDSLIPIGDALLDHINPRLDDFSAWITENKEPIEQTFIAIFNAIDKVVEGLEELLSEKVLPFVKEIFEDPRFTEGVASIAAGFGIIAFEANRFVESGVGRFLADLTKESLLKGLGQLGRNLENIGTALGIINDTINLFQGKGGTTTRQQLEQLFEDVQRIGPFGVSADIGKAIREAVIGSEIQKLESVRIPGRAVGGPVSGGSPYIVGERGPELFIPGGSGSIVPNNRMGGSNINITVNAGMGANGASIGQEIVSAIKRYERTSGPVFASA